MEATEPKKWSLMEFLTLWQCLSLSLSLLTFPQSPFGRCPNQNSPAEHIITKPKKALVTYFIQQSQQGVMKAGGLIVLYRESKFRMH